MQVELLVKIASVYNVLIEIITHHIGVCDVSYCIFLFIFHTHILFFVTKILFKHNYILPSSYVKR